MNIFTYIIIHTNNIITKKNKKTTHIFTTTKVGYGDKTFRHNMSLFHHRRHMVTKLVSSPKPCHKMSW